MTNRTDPRSDPWVGVQRMNWLWTLPSLFLCYGGGGNHILLFMKVIGREVSMNLRSRFLQDFKHKGKTGCRTKATESLDCAGVQLL